MTNVYELKPKKLRVWTDTVREEYALKCTDDTPIRIHAPNGGYLYSLYWNPEYGLLAFTDLRWK